MRDLFSRSFDRSRSFSLSLLSRSRSLFFLDFDEGEVDPANVDAAAVRTIEYQVTTKTQTFITDFESLEPFKNSLSNYIKTYKIFCT